MVLKLILFNAFFERKKNQVKTILTVLVLTFYRLFGCNYFLQFSL